LLSNKKISLIIPTLNAGNSFKILLQSIKKQSLTPDQVIVIDSESDDATADIAREYGCIVISIRRQDFNHGSTRQLGVEQTDAEIVVFLTQDAILASADSLKNLIECFNDPAVGAAYGRQLPHYHSLPIGAHARLLSSLPYLPLQRILRLLRAANTRISSGPLLRMMLRQNWPLRSWLRL
jgi:rhamnosyltransferase